MKMKLMSMHLENFKCYKDFEINFGEVTKVSGVNGVGKTTLADAVNWVLFDKLSNGQQAKNIRPHDENGKDIDFIEISVTLNLLVDSKPVNIKKTQKQKWTKPRGQREKRFDGNFNEYEVNTIPKTEKDFKAFFSDIIDEEVFKYASNAATFMSKSIKDKRAKLFELVTDITDEDVILAEVKLEELRPLLSDFTQEELSSKNKKVLSEFKKKINEIPSRIDEVSKLIIEVNVPDLELRRDAIRADLDEINNSASTFESEVKANQKLNQDYMGVQEELNKLIRTTNQALQSAKAAAQQEHSKISDSTYRILTEKNNKEQELKMLHKRIEVSKADLTALGEKYKKVNSEEFDVTKLICPTCGREFEAEKKEESLAHFSAEKERRLKQINLDGNATSESIKTLTVKAETLQVEFETLEQLFNDSIAKKGEAYTYLTGLPESVDLATNDEYNALNSKMLELKEQLELPNDSVSAKEKLDFRRKSLMLELDEVSRRLSAVDSNAKVEKRIEELKKEQQELGQKIADAEKEQFLLELFEKTKINMLTDKINEHFKVIEWVLFEQQINGGYKEVCVPMINGSKYGEGLNSGHAILAELDLIDTLQKIYDVSIPVFLDNAERLSSDNMPDMDCQLVTLTVADDENMKVEVIR